MTKYYETGDVITKPRMQEEPWYSHYQSLCEMAAFSNAKGKELTSMFLTDYREIFKKDYPDMEQLIRWSKLLSSR